MNKIFVDLQGFKFKSNVFIAKEVAVVFNSKEYVNFIIKSPFSINFLTMEQQKQAKWLIKNFHHINWNDGYVSYSSVCNFLKVNLKYSNIYVKGLEKKKWLENILGQEVFNIEDFGCINFRQLEVKYPKTVRCSYHTGGVCALKNALLLKAENIV